jgi:DNA segregation ATPase FtsK/SpoIIIE-like protein
LFSSSDYDSKTLRAAADLVIKSRRAEATFLQRRLHIGYDDAMILLDELRDEGIVGGEPGSPKGILLIDPEAWATD